jgi:hypothetical protein
LNFHFLCKQGVIGSIPTTSGKSLDHHALVPPYPHAQQLRGHFSLGLASRMGTLEQLMQKASTARAAHFLPWIAARELKFHHCQLVRQIDRKICLP